MSFSDSNQEHDVFHINRYSIARYLFSKKTAAELQISLVDALVSDYSNDLENFQAWQNYQNKIKKEIARLHQEGLNLHAMDSRLGQEFNAEDSVIIQKINRRIEIQNQIAKLNQEKNNIEMINEFIHDDERLEKFLMQEESQEHSLMKHQEEKEEAAEKLMTYAESTFESAGSATEANERVQDYTEQLNRMVERGDSAQSDMSSGGEHVTTAATTLKTLPLVSDFVRGLNSLREAYEAYKNPHTPERKTKMAVGVFAGLVSIGVGVIGSLVVAGVGLLAGAAAITIAPIVAGALLIGVYSANLYRDHQVLKHAQAELNEATHLLKNLEKDFAHETENVITRHLASLDQNKITPDVQLVLNKENEIRALHQELYQAEQNHAATDITFGLKEKIHTAYHERNQQISKTKDLKKDIIYKLQNDPRLGRITLQKNKLTHSVNQLTIARDAANKKRLFSAICMIGVGIALAAICATGVGAIVLGGIAALTLLGASIARVIQTRQAAKAITQLKTSIPPKQAHAHSSLYDIDYRLLDRHKEKMTGLLVNQQQEIQMAQSKAQTQETKEAPKQETALKISKENKESDHHLTKRH